MNIHSEMGTLTFSTSRIRINSFNFDKVLQTSFCEAVHSTCIHVSIKHLIEFCYALFDSVVYMKINHIQKLHSIFQLFFIPSCLDSKAPEFIIILRFE